MGGGLRPGPVSWLSTHKYQLHGREAGSVHLGNELSHIQHAAGRHMSGGINGAKARVLALRNPESAWRHRVGAVFLTRLAHAAARQQ